jgi:hypothetical protein
MERQSPLDWCNGYGRQLVAGKYLEVLNQLPLLQKPCGPWENPRFGQLGPGVLRSLFNSLDLSVPEEKFWNLLVATGTKYDYWLTHISNDHVRGAVGPSLSLAITSPPPYGSKGNGTVPPRGRLCPRLPRQRARARPCTVQLDM